MYKESRGPHGVCSASVHRYHMYNMYNTHPTHIYKHTHSTNNTHSHNVMHQINSQFFQMVVQIKCLLGAIFLVLC